MVEQRTNPTAARTLNSYRSSLATRTYPSTNIELLRQFKGMPPQTQSAFPESRRDSMFVEENPQESPELLQQFNNVRIPRPMSMKPS